MEKKIRPSALAGTWYEGSADRLDSELGGLLEQTPRRVAGQVRALIEPHAGYRYSGRGAAAGYQLVQSRDYRRVVVLAPSHYAGFHGFSIVDATHFQTPLGELRLDLEAMEPLRQSSLHRSMPRAHIQEHSIEIQAPFLQKMLPDVPMVPLLIGHLNREDYPALAEELRPWIDEKALIVASSDFTHQGPRFDYQPFDSDLPRQIRALDFGGYAPISRLDPSGFLDYVDRTGITICGFRPIGLLLNLLPEDSQGRVVSYYTSGDVTGDWENSVSYLTTVFQEPDPHPPFQVDLLDAPARRAALRLARESMERHVRRQAPSALPSDLPPALLQPGACFVTLQQNGALRGCIGNILEQGPLAESIVRNARSAATEDPRFFSVAEKELPDLELEISVLTPPQKVGGPEHIELGRHGVILSRRGRRAVFLPQVAVSQVWSREELLSQLSAKAGLKQDAWREGAEFEVFSCQVFSEKDPAA